MVELERFESGSDVSPARFVLELGRDLHEAGASADRLEEAMVALGERLGLEIQVFSTPTSIFMATGEVGRQETAMLRVQPGDVDLERMIRVDYVVQRVVSGVLSPAAGIAELERIPVPSERWGLVSTLAAFSGASGAASVFFGGGWGDVFASLLLGLMTGAILVLGSRFRRLRRVLEAVVALTVSVCGLLIARVVSPFLVDGLGVDARWVGVAPELVTLSSLIVLLPGLTLTLAMSELAGRHLVSGTGRLTHAAMILMSVGLGVALGRSIGGFLPALVVSGGSAPGWLLAGALVVGPVCFMVLFRARHVDLAAILVAGLVGFGGARLGAWWLGPEVGAGLGALAVGLLANAYSRVFEMPSAVAAIPGIMLLVPGSLGYRSIEALLSADAVRGVETVFAMLLVAASLVVGLLLANVLLPTRRLV